MIEINHECYVSLEVAKLLRQLGFDLECRKIYYCYHEDGDTWELEDNHKNHRRILELDYCLLAPTLEVAQRWLREVKDVDVNILTDFDSVKRLYYVRYIVKDGHYKTYYITNNQSYVYFNTYEEAQEAGIQKCLTILLEK